MLEKVLDFLFVFEFKVCFFIGFDDVDEYFYFFQFDYFDMEQEYVILDNNYIVRVISILFYIRYYFMLDFKRN